MKPLLEFLLGIPLSQLRTLFTNTVRKDWNKRIVAFGIIPVFSLGMNPFGAISFDQFTLSSEGIPSIKESVIEEDITAKREILWLARALYSESKVQEEQLLVAWVIRNRVESGQYPDTYERVVLQKGQFSGLHATDKQYWTNIGLDYNDTSTAWDSALEIADAVYHARGTLRPLSKDVLHFYSPISVKYDPKWATGTDPVHVVRSENTAGIRFAFYAGIK